MWSWRGTDIERVDGQREKDYDDDEDDEEPVRKRGERMAVWPFAVKSNGV